MKKFFFIPFLAAGVALSAFAASDVSGLNQEIQKLLAPFQSESTIARLAFVKAETNEERALSLLVSGLYRKAGTQNILAVAIDNLGYEYGDGSAPTTTLQGSVGLDLTKVFSQADLNEIIPNLEQTIEQLSHDYIGQYGEAITIETKITDRTQDENGNYTGVKGSIRFSFDFTKLPEGVSKEDIIAQSGSASIAVNVKTGISLDAQVVSNTSYRGFHEENAGLKDLLDKFLSQDPATMDQLKGLFQQLDDMANQVVNGSRQ